MQLTAPDAATTPGAISCALMSAALGLASIAPLAATPPDATQVSFKYLDYLDYSIEGRRMHVREPLLYVHAPLGDNYSLEASAIIDTMSGASPEFHNSLTGASGKGVRDERHAFDLKLHRYFHRTAVAVGVATSNEFDYTSQTLNAEVQQATEDQNTLLTLGWSRTLDDIGSAWDDYLQEHRRSSEYLAGVTQVISPVAILQSNISYKASTGFHDDPYKAADKRPDGRHQFIWLTRYNQHFPTPDMTLNLEYRYFQDNWDIRAHTLGAALTMPITQGWRLKPSLRYYSQSAAYFYSDTFPPKRFGRLYSADYRLGSFGAVTAGLKLSHDLDRDTVVDVALERYEQKSAWRWSGSGSSTLESVYARSLMFGIPHFFH